MDGVALEPGDRRRRRAGRAAFAGLVAMAAWEVLALASTQVSGVRAHSPWQDDPYDAVVSVTMFCVPAVAALVCLRVQLCRRDAGLPLTRLAGVLRATSFGLLLCLVTSVPFVVAWLLASRPDGPGSPGGGGPVTAALGSGAVLVTAAVVAALASVRRAGAGLGAGWSAEGGTPRDDWSADLVPLGELAAARLPLGRHLATLTVLADRYVLGGRWGVRRHPVAWTVGTAALAGTAVVTGLVVVEGTPWWVAGPLGLVVGGSGFLLVLVGAHRALGLAVVRPGRPALRRVGVAAAVGLEAAFALRDQLWALLDPGGGVPALPATYLVMLAGATAGLAVGGCVELVSRSQKSQRPRKSRVNP